MRAVAARCRRGAERRRRLSLRLADAFLRDLGAPVLSEHCLKCHGPAKQWNGLRLDSRKALLRGGDSGPAIVPGQPDQSRLIRAIRHSDDELQMPPESKLSPRQIDDLRGGSKWGLPFRPQRIAHPLRASRHAIQIIGHFSRPAVLSCPRCVTAKWPQTPIDRFVLARLEAMGLQPATAGRPASTRSPGDVRPDRSAADARRG